VALHRPYQDANGYAEQLRNELFARAQAHHEPGFEVVHQISRLPRAAARDRCCL
jgi:hypothetical protein